MPHHFHVDGVGSMKALAENHLKSVEKDRCNTIPHVKPLMQSIECVCMQSAHRSVGSMQCRYLQSRHILVIIR